MNRSVTVIGGGGIGLSIALEMAQRGVETSVIQRDPSSDITSWSAAGILPPARLEQALDPLDRLRGFSHQLYPEWIAQLESTTGVDCGFRKCGGWYLATSPGERAAMVGMTGYWKELGISCHAVSEHELAEREPSLTSWSKGAEASSAWWVPNEWQIRPPHLLRALRTACQSSGVKFRDRTEVVDIATNDGQPHLLVGGNWEKCDQVVLSAGAWSGKIARNLGMEKSVIPIRGQMLLLKTPSSLLTSVVNVGHRYLVPRDDGYLLVGSCEEEVGFEQGTTSDMLESLRQFAVSLIPELKSAESVSHWSGIRPMTFDGFPMIGRVPNESSIYVAAGHFRSGWHLAPATAKCLVALMLGEKPAVDLIAFGAGKKQICGDAPTHSYMR
ncbi:MAG: glycine oxidase ThiO [Planctomycetota bacterium]